MSEKRHWSAVVASKLAKLADRLDERRAEVTAEQDEQPDAPPPKTRPRPQVPRKAGSGTAAESEPRPAPKAVAAAGHPPQAPGGAQLPDPLGVVPWSMRVAAEVAWRLLVLAGTVWVLMRIIGAIQLVVLAFVAALLITALLQPVVGRLRRAGVPRGLATGITFIGGFVLMGLVGWFVVWQVMDNVDDLSTKLTDGVAEMKRWLLNSPFHVTEDQINQLAKNLTDTISTNTKAVTDAGLQGVTVIVELLTGMLLAMFSTLFLLYDGRNIWNWTLKLFPAAARDGLAGAGPRAWRTLTLYVRGTVIVALIDAVFIGVGIWFLNVPMAVPLAVVIFVAAFVPLVGAVASGALAMVVALVTEGPFTALMVLIVVLAVQQIEGHILQPFILGRAVRVHPLAVVLSVAAGSLIAGIGGAVVAVPLVAVTNTVVGYLRSHAREAAMVTEPGPHGATVEELAPIGGLAEES
ncbi:AI-2E family transporter [Streptomyces sp. SID13666]|uniref:AI-2E family transporter n=1 Tax=unclassified Streptomyces TaxID=2593676 RepID=UPI0013C1B24D|nr:MULTISPECIES: AI-2E family transporter [unclassified Streptomyces]NEA58434.1 AI-2E family transporter [Streptomyces sp. SID13666]NEA73596.1 AI-2E family transporter [Streptomyces sp. SID13588]